MCQECVSSCSKQDRVSVLRIFVLFKLGGGKGQADIMSKIRIVKRSKCHEKMKQDNGI